jgi:transcriptional regulator with XRE-family HTH domain
MDALSSYLDERNERLSTFAVRIGRSPSTLSRALSGQRDPSVDLARDVEKGTQGSVTTLQFLEICLAAQAAAQPSPSEVAA